MRQTLHVLMQLCKFVRIDQPADFTTFDDLRPAGRASPFLAYAYMLSTHDMAADIGWFAV